jgi:hypothetical protein
MATDNQVGSCKLVEPKLLAMVHHFQLEVTLRLNQAKHNQLDLEHAGQNHVHDMAAYPLDAQQ